jgi:FkbM family methyltransferase
VRNQHTTAIGHETVVVMVLRSFPCLPEGPSALQDSFLRLARSFAATNQPLAAGWATMLAQGRTFRFGCDASCQIVVLPALYHAILPEQPGWFVEVGAFDGTTFSNTANLADLGWRGLYVEPHRVYLDLCRKRHAASPGVRFENCAVGRAAGEGVFRPDGPLSTVSADRGADDAGGEPVAIVRLETLLEKHGVPRGFELLVIDVEGHDEAVLDSFDLAEWSPRVIIAEIGGLDLTVPQPADHRWRMHDKLSRHGYRIVYFDYINVIYCAAEVSL